MSRIDAVGAALHPTITQVMNRVPPREVASRELPTDDTRVKTAETVRKIATPEDVSLPRHRLPPTFEQLAERRNRRDQWPLREQTEDPAPRERDHKVDTYL